MARARRVDATQAPIVEALRKIGAKVRSTANVGDDFPDLCVGFQGRTILLEVKSAGQSLTKGQEAFAASWPGECHTVHSVDEALAVVIGEKAMA